MKKEFSPAQVQNNVIEIQIIDYETHKVKPQKGPVIKNVLASSIEDTRYFNSPFSPAKRNLMASPADERNTELTRGRQRVNFSQNIDEDSQNTTFDPTNLQSTQK